MITSTPPPSSTPVPTVTEIPATPTTAATAIAVTTPSVHEIVPGETLLSIGEMYGVPEPLIAAANGLANADLIVPGTQLFIPTADGHLPPEAPLAGIHIVVAGDSLSAIAANFNVSTQSLMSLNQISNSDAIALGSVIKIPKQGAQAPSPTPTILTTYTVQAGDTLSSIANHVGITIDALMSANGLTDRNVVFEGQVLTIPGA